MVILVHRLVEHSSHFSSVLCHTASYTHTFPLPAASRCLPVHVPCCTRTLPDTAPFAFAACGLLRVYHCPFRGLHHYRGLRAGGRAGRGIAFARTLRAGQRAPPTRTCIADTTLPRRCHALVLPLPLRCARYIADVCGRAHCRTRTVADTHTATRYRLAIPMPLHTTDAAYRTHTGRRFLVHLHGTSFCTYIFCTVHAHCSSGDTTALHATTDTYHYTTGRQTPRLVLPRTLRAPLPLRETRTVRSTLPNAAAVPFPAARVLGSFALRRVAMDAVTFCCRSFLVHAFFCRLRSYTFAAVAFTCRYTDDDTDFLFYHFDAGVPAVLFVGPFYAHSASCRSHRCT